MAAMGQRFGAKQRIVESVAEVNRMQCDLVVQKVETALEGLSGKQIAVWGLSFKPNTDDVRESPAISICRKLCGSRRLACGPSTRLRLPMREKFLMESSIARMPTVLQKGRMLC